MQSRQHDAGKARADIAFQLGREVNFRHQNQDLRIVLARQHLGASLQIHFRLATARHAVQQGRLEALGAADGVRRFLLGGIQGRHVQRRAVVRVGQLAQLLDGTVQRHGGEHAQIFRQTGQRYFTERALVVIGGKGGQRQPLCRQRYQLAAHGQHVLQFRGRHVGAVGDADDQPHHFAPAEWHQRQLSHLRQRRGSVRTGIGRRVPAVVEQGVQGRVERDFQDARRQNALRHGRWAYLNKKARRRVGGARDVRHQASGP
ncbi:hypothetical protein D3C85_217920 [compost metagenome]